MGLYQANIELDLPIRKPDLVERLPWLANGSATGELEFGDSAGDNGARSLLSMGLSTGRIWALLLPF